MPDSDDAATPPAPNPKAKAKVDADEKSASGDTELNATDDKLTSCGDAVGKAVGKDKFAPSGDSEPKADAAAEEAQLDTSGGVEEAGGNSATPSESAVVDNEGGSDDEQERFPQQLWDLVESETREGGMSAACGNRVIEWLPEGDGFIVRDKHLLVKQVLPRYFFGRCKYLSFTRKLYRWGFRQADKTFVNTNVFKNPDFIRGARSKCSNMKSTVVKRQPPPSSPSSTPGPGAGRGRRRRGRGGGRAGRQHCPGERGGDLPSQMVPGQIFGYPAASGEMVPMMMLPMPVAAGMMMSGGGENMPAGVRACMERMILGVGLGGDGGSSGGMWDMPMRDMPSMRDMQSQMVRDQMMGWGSTMGGLPSSGFSSHHGDGGGGDGGGSMMRDMHGSDMRDRDGMRQDMSQGGDNIDSILLKRASLNRLRETPGGMSDSGAFDRFGRPGPSVSQQQHDSIRRFAGYSAHHYDQLNGGPGGMYYSRAERRQIPEAYDDRNAVEIMRRLRNEYGRSQGYQTNYMANQGFGSPSGRTNQDGQGSSGHDQRDHSSSGQSTGFGCSSQPMGGQSYYEQGRR